MVGDRSYDVKGAQAMGIDSVGVLYGYGSREELEKAGATKIAKSVEDLKNILLNWEDKNGEKSFDGMVLTVTSKLFFEKIQSTKREHRVK